MPQKSFLKTRLKSFTHSPARTFLYVVLTVAMTKIILAQRGTLATGVIAFFVVVAAFLQILYPKK